MNKKIGKGRHEWERACVEKVATSKTENLNENQIC
jgi:hypothetical protein